ncbi:hypothetical protein K502DRAFT_366274 [Neoconidiobolus thromboides FSU 785]|nr:hypothetical protein K502DRAFT_366274 [Neoconidiobolus thromboides FSU 785]
MKYLSLLSVLVASGLSLKTPVKYDQLYIFGDSLSDYDNLYKLSNHTAPDGKYYYQGRYSNGPTWIERLSKKLSIPNVKSFAYSAATSDNVEFPATLVPGGVPGAIQQADQFVKYYDELRNKRKKPRYPLVAFAFGGNDFPSPGSSPQKMVGNLEKSLTKIIDECELKSLLIMTSTPLDLSPATKSLPKEYQAQLEQITRQIGSLWKETINRLRLYYPHIRIHTFDSRDILLQAIKKKTSEGANTNEINSPCLTKAENPEKSFIAYNVCSNPEKHIFYDSIHPTSYTHEYFANDIYNMMKK